MGAEETIAKFGPKTADHNTIGHPCPACGVKFEEGIYTTLIALGPGGNQKARDLKLEGRPYNAVALEIHWGCVTGEPDK